MGDKRYKNHLVILQHGFHATSQDFNIFINYFSKQSQLDNCLFIAAKNNDYFLATHEGIDKIGERLFKEVKEIYKENQQCEYISFIGHSLGGLIVRYAIGLLYIDGFFENCCKPINFISLTSPHVGSRRPTTTLYNKLLLFGANNFLSITGKQLILTDSHILIINDENVEEKEEKEKEEENTLPLLVYLSEGIFLKGLKSFKNCSLYSNIYNDLQVSFCTSDINVINPYRLTFNNIKFSKKYRHIIENNSEDNYNNSNNNNNINNEIIENHFKHDTHHELLKRIIINLNQIKFKRYHMYFNSILSHTNVIVRREWLNSEGYDILIHILDHFENSKSLSSYN
ncbi:hypothetical protein RB653_009274 [Dictyostelium firmibasis]|uniref:DUF676 domain-containing protein n=1 Tax=Dictyostelium firmibasis TaxID=79012 RepID=A0AAN7Z0H7_9MYCE